MPTLREYEQELQRDPAHKEAYLALRKVYREGRHFDKLVTLYESRAQALDDGPKAAELFYLAAELRLDQLGDPAGAQVDLAHAVDRDPANLKATSRLKQLYREEGRHSDYVALLEGEAAEVARSKDPARVAELQAELAQLFGQHFARLEKALTLTGPHRAAEVTPDSLKGVESARKMYRALGDYQNVVRLYELELGLTTDAKRRTDLLLGLGRVLGDKIGDLDGAAQRLGEVVRLRPRDDKALEALAAVYANPKWIGADGRERAAGIYHQVARRRHEAGDIDNAIASLRKALAAAPGHGEAGDLLEKALYGAGRFADLDLYYRERVAAAQSDEERMDFLFKRAQLSEGDLGNPAEALRIYEEIVAIEPSGGPASQHLAALYLGNHDYGKLAELRERQLEVATDPAFRLAALTELAALYRDRLGDAEQAAVYYHAILQIDPANAEASQAYAEHFRERGDWPALVDLLEFTFDQVREAGLPVDQQLARLEEIAVLAERNLGDVERALSAWQRMEEISPGHERAREAQKRILQKGKQWARMVSVLEREVKNAADPAQKIEILGRLARLHQEKLGASDKAVVVYQEILRADPKDPQALRSLQEILEREEKWAELAKLLRDQVQQVVLGKQEKLNLLRRLLVLYDDRLRDEVEGSWTATEILKLLPGDREALARLENILERSGDQARLVQTLEYHTRYVTSPDEKQALLARIADLLQNQIGDVTQAALYWEQLLQIAPGHSRALAALCEIYERENRPEDLARVVELQVGALGDDPLAQVEHLRRLARLNAEVLNQPSRALRAWEDLARVAPADRDALAALSAIYSGKGDWKALVGILDRRIPLESDPTAAVSFALERARIFEEELKNRHEAVAALERLIDELDPRNAAAHESLRRISEADGDWQRVVKVAERQLSFAEDPEQRVALSLDLGALWRDRLGDGRKALAAFERVVEIDPRRLDALYALGPLYAASNDSQHLVSNDEKILALVQDPPERRRLMLEIAQTFEGLLAQPRLAFEWYRRAHHDESEPSAMPRMEAIAEAHGLWEELISAYEGERSRTQEPAAQLLLVRKIARLAEENLDDAARAFAVLRDALASEPAGETLLAELERLAEVTRDWPGLLDVYGRVARGRPATGERVELLGMRAEVREHRMGDPSGALDDFLRSFALDPDNVDTRQNILRLAEITGRWEDALAAEGQLFARAATVAARVEVACRAARLVEENVKDPLRAFRAYLNAFRLAPDNEVIVANLWRLAALLGRYDAPAVPVAAPVAAHPSSPEVDGVDDGEALVLDEDLEEIEDGPELAASPPSLNAAARRGAFVSAWEELVSAYELLPAADGAVRFGYLRKIADIWERGAQQVDKAIEALERAFRLDVADEAVHAELWRLAEQEDRWDQICDLFVRAIEAAGRDEAVALNHEVARHREARSRMDLAEDRYQAVLILAPDDAVALSRLEDMFRTQERWAELASLLEKRTTGVIEALQPGAERRRKSFELAELYEDRLERPYEAIDTLENYVAAMDEDERGADNADVLRECAEAYEALARLYSRVGMWTKAVEAVTRQTEMVSDPATRRDLWWRAAEIQEKELRQPDEAVSIYEALLAALPQDADALAALDRLHAAHGRFEELEKIIQRRADLASGDERAALIRRRAKILEEKLVNPDGAAACLRSLGAEALSDDETAAALLRNLRSAGLGDEAHRVLQQRIDMLSSGASEPERLVTLHLQLANLRLDQLGDAVGARAAIDAALEIAPQNAAAFAALARLLLNQNDFAGYAKARLNEGKALKGQPAAAAAYLEAGRVCRDQLDDPGAAGKCFERALKEEPENQEALRSLAGLKASEGKLDEARALFERQLAIVEETEARAPILTDLARTLWEKPGDSLAALPFLDEALDLAPDYLPAAVTMADIFFKEQQWEQAERRLSQVLRRMRGDAVESAKLYYRLAEVYEKLGRLDDGYRQLVEADRMMPGQLLVRLSLGENRFHAKKWREAATYLDGIAQHPEAAAYPEEVAQGLARAAQSELKLKRPERAVALYEAALGLSAEHRPSLRALADLALERGEKRQAVQYLRRLAESSGERAERAQLFEQMGDLYQGLEDPAEARRSYEAALGMISPVTEDHIPLLGKTLALQRDDGAVREAGETAQRLIDLEQDPTERAARRREAAMLLMGQGETARATEYLERALADNPTDEEALAGLATVYEQAGRLAEIEPFVARVLPGLAPLAADASVRARAVRAELWERLGTLARGKDDEAAIAAYDKAVEADTARLAARLALVELYGDRPRYRQVALDNHRALVAGDLTRATSLRALARAYADAGQTDWARCHFEMLALLGLADDDDRAFLDSHPAPLRNAEDPYAGTIEDADRGRSLAHPDARVMAEVFAAIWEGVPGLNAPTLESLGVDAQDKVSPLSELTIGKVYGQAAKALSNKRTSLYISWDSKLDAVVIAGTPPPSIVVGQRLVTGEDTAEMRFCIGRALELTRPEYILAATLAPKDFAQLFASVLKAFHPRHSRWRAGAQDAATEQAAKLKKALPYKVSKRLAELFQENDSTPFSSVRWRAVVIETGNRAGLLLCGDLQAAARVVMRELASGDSPPVDAALLREHAVKDGPLRALLRYAVSEDYFALRASLGIGVSRAAAA